MIYRVPTADHIILLFFHYLCSMNTSISIKTPQFRFNIKHILLIVAFVVSAFVITNYVAIKQAAENTPDLSIEDIESLAEEIYTTGGLGGILDDLPIEDSLIKKMQTEIERILSKTVDHQGCEVYYLQVIYDDNFPILNYGNVISGFVYLKEGDVWKVGQTCNGEDRRYPSDVYYNLKQIDLRLTKEELIYVRVASGSYKQMLILEKVLIYTYPLWSGYPYLIKPPGCKIFR